MPKLKVFNNIAEEGLSCFPEQQYKTVDDNTEAEVVILRSHDLHKETFGPSLLAVGRAGAGVNNIPVDDLSNQGVPVFNTPGANANAVKELVLCAILMACRNVPFAWDYTRQLTETGNALKTAVEKAKKQFAGFELPGKTLAVIGLGAIGVSVANAAVALGMQVIGFDPLITVKRAWQLSSQVKQAQDIDQLLQQADFITCHVPLLDATRHIINADRIANMKPQAVLLNFSRDGIVDVDAVCQALAADKLYSYVSDFPTDTLLKQPRAIALPHLGASTREAEINCAVMVANQLREFIEHGNLVNSVNFPDINLGALNGNRLAICNLNKPNMVGQVTTQLADASINITNMVNASKGDYAYTLMDISQAPDAKIVDAISQIDGVLSVRIIN